MKKSEQSLNDLQDNHQVCQYTHYQSHRKRERIFEEFTAKHFPNLMNVINQYIKEAQRTPMRINSKCITADMLYNKTAKR